MPQSNLLTQSHPLTADASLSWILQAHQPTVSNVSGTTILVASQCEQLRRTVLLLRTANGHTMPVFLDLDSLSLKASPPPPTMSHHQPSPNR
eukprot:3197816-Pyramimonas_sp.AAC.1